MFELNLITGLVWVVCLLLFGLFVCAAVGNWWLIFSHLIHGTKGSMVPFIGGLCGCLAVLMAPVELSWKWCWWIPLVADPGFSYMLLSVPLEVLDRRDR